VQSTIVSSTVHGTEYSGMRERNVVTDVRNSMNNCFRFFSGGGGFIAVFATVGHSCTIWSHASLIHVVPSHILKVGILNMNA